MIARWPEDEVTADSGSRPGWSGWGDLQAAHVSTFHRCLIWIVLSAGFLSGLDVVVNTGPVQLTHLLLAVSLVLIVLANRALPPLGAIGLFFALLAISAFSILATAPTFGHIADRLFDSVLRIFLAVMLVAAYYGALRLAGSIQALFREYLKVALFFALVALGQELVFLVAGIDVFGFMPTGAKEYGAYLGVSGLSVEPAYLAFALLPAASYHVVHLISSLRVSISGVVTVAAVILSTSSNGFLGLGVAGVIATVVALVVYVRQQPLRVAALVFIVLLLSPAAFWMSQQEYFQLRVQDSLSLLEVGATRSTGANLSSYALAVNSEITTRSLADNGWFGAGFGLNSWVFDHYIGNYEIPSYRDTLPGRGTAASLYLRLFAEIGLAGLVLILLVVLGFLYAIWRNSERAIAIAFLATFLVMLLRMGAYLDNGAIFVMLMSLLLYRRARDGRETGGRQRLAVTRRGSRLPTGAPVDLPSQRSQGAAAT